MSTTISNRRRYFLFFLLVFSAGAIYPIIYLRQNFETAILEAFNITSGDIGQFYSILGVLFVICYLPSGWLADRFSPRYLIGISLIMVGVFGFWFSTYPSLSSLRFIFIGWGLSAGLAFWAALIKGVKLLAKPTEQGRFFGVLDGGRGLVEALLASVAIGIFAYFQSKSLSQSASLLPVIYMYSVTCIVVGITTIMLLKIEKTETKTATKSNIFKDIKILLKIKEVWMLGFIIIAGYQLFWATYSFSEYLQSGFELTPVMAGLLTVAKLWMRPIGGVGAGFLGDKISKGGVLAFCIFTASSLLVLFAFYPKNLGMVIIVALILLIGVLTYAIRGLYWSLLDNCNVPPTIVGLAIGVISMIGYLPDIYLPAISDFFLTKYQDNPVIGYRFYFSTIAIMGIIGGFISLKFVSRINKNK